MKRKNIVLNVKRLEIKQIEKRLNILLGLSKYAETEEFAFLTMLTLTKESNKHKLPARAPFPAIVKKAGNGQLAVFCCTNAKQEIIPEGSYREPTPVGNTFEYKGHVYKKNPVYPIYTLSK